MTHYTNPDEIAMAYSLIQKEHTSLLEENTNLKKENAILVARCTRLQKSFEAQHRMHVDAAAKRDEVTSKLKQHLSGIPVPAEIDLA